MAFFSDLARAVAQAEGMDEMTVIGIGQYLRDGGMIAKGGRGRSAARMSCRDAANLLIAVNATALAKDAAIAVQLFRGLKHNSTQTELSVRRLEDLNSAFSDFGSALERLISWCIPDSAGQIKLEQFLADQTKRATKRNMKEVAQRRQLIIPTATLEISFTRPKRSACVHICTPYLNYNQTAFVMSDGLPAEMQFTDESDLTELRDRRDVTTISAITLKSIAETINS